MNIEQLEKADPHEFRTLYEAWREHEPGYDWWDSVFEMAVEDGAERGFMIDVATRTSALGKRADKEPCIYFSGFWSQGDGASWVGHVDIPKWIEWMRVERQRELDSGPCRPGNGTPFTDEQLLWIDEGYLINWLEPRMHIQGDTRYSHSGTMQPSDGDKRVSSYDEEVPEGVFAGMNCDAFVEAFEQIVGDTLFEEALGAARKFADEIYRNLEQEYEYLTSEEAFKQAMADEEYPDA